ncbi:MAG: hypothetical protein L6R48_13410 [Planctomycetes bacterium]|nr:hypothetical protein [Planctomycetota bacterium]
MVIIVRSPGLGSIVAGRNGEGKDRTLVGGCGVGHPPDPAGEARRRSSSTDLVAHPQLLHRAGESLPMFLSRSVVCANW